MTEQAERHLHYLQAEADLNEAWNLAHAIRAAGDYPLVAAAFKYLVVAYARPFKLSGGTDSLRRRLEGDFVPSEHLEMHQRLLDSRDKVLAHSDLTVREPQLHVYQASTRKAALVVQNVVYGSEELPNLNAIIALIEAVLRGLSEKIDQSEGALPVTLQQ